MTIKEAKKELKEIIRYTKRRDDYAADCVPVELLEAILDYVSKQEAKINDYKQRCESAEERYTTLVRTAAESVEKKTKTAQKHAVQEFADKIKEKVYPFLQAEMYNKKHFITGDHLSDKLLENQNIGILKAQDVLSKWFKVKIDELLKEYENGKDKD